MLQRVGMVALRNFSHADREYHSGERFEAEPVQAAILVRSHDARLTSITEDMEAARAKSYEAPQQQVITPAAQAPTPKAKRVRRPRQSNRRDMVPDTTK